MEKPESHSLSAFEMTAVMTKQNSMAERMSPCFTPFRILIVSDVPMSVLMAAVESSLGQFQEANISLV